MTESNGNQTRTEMHKNKVIHKVSPQYVRTCRKKVWKTDGRRVGRTDGDPDITIIRPVEDGGTKMSFRFV